jgi:hypothetical protein
MVMVILLLLLLLFDVLRIRIVELPVEPVKKSQKIRRL